jgi:hypothetical protein
LLSSNKSLLRNAACYLPTPPPSQTTNQTMIFAILAWLVGLAALGGFIAGTVKG